MSRAIILLMIFGGLYFGYEKYEDHKLAKHIRTQLKKPINMPMPPEMEAVMNTSVTNNYPILNFNIAFKELSKSDLNQAQIEQMKKMSFMGSCQGFYRTAQKDSEYGRKMVAKIAKEDQITIVYSVKDKADQIIFESKNPISSCPNFNTLEAGGSPAL